MELNYIILNAFENTKRIFAETTAILFPKDPKKSFILNMDASIIAVGPSSNQKDIKGNPLPVSFFSKMKSNTEVIVHI